MSPKRSSSILHWRWLHSGPIRFISLQDLELFGLLFESTVIRDLRVYAQADDAEVFHYRDNTGPEVDAVIEAADGCWMAVEVKLGGPDRPGCCRPPEAAEPGETSRIGEPTKLVVVAGIGYGYERPMGSPSYLSPLSVHDNRRVPRLVYSRRSHEAVWIPFRYPGSLGSVLGAW